MALIRANSQLLDGSLNWEKLEADFLDGNNLNLTNGNNNATITGLADPSSDRDVATKSYVDVLVQGLKGQDSARVRAQGNVATLSGLQTIDGAALQDGDQILLDQQTTVAEDGLYIVRSGAWERHPDWQAGETAGARYIFIVEGTDDNKGFVCTNNTGSDIIGTHDLVFTQFSGAGTINAGAGMLQTGSNFDIQAADNSMTINADDIQVNIGNDNGTSLEVTTTGLELASIITGARTFTTGSGNFSVSTGSDNINFSANYINFTDNEVLNASSTTAIPFSITATVDYGNGNGTSVGSVIDQFRADFTDDAIINALCQLKAEISSSALTIGNGLTNTSGVISAGDSTSDSITWSFNDNNSLFLNSANYVGANNEQMSCQFYAGDSGVSPTIHLRVEGNYGMDTLSSLQLRDDHSVLRYKNTNITLEENLANSGNGGVLNGGVNNWSLDTSPDGTVNLAIATVAYVNSSVGNVTAGNGLTNNSGTLELGGTITKTTTITDGRASGSQNGIEYAADYSADYSDRSLVDKEFVENAIDAENGLSKNTTNNKVKLGGYLLENTLIEAGTYDLKFEHAPGMGELSHVLIAGSSNAIEMYSQTVSSNTKISTKSTDGKIVSTDGTNTATISVVGDGTGEFSSTTSSVANKYEISDSGLTLSVDDTLGGGGVGVTTVGMTSSKITITTSANNGMEYAADYSGNNSSNNRWIPDKAYVDSAVVSGNTRKYNETTTLNIGNQTATLSTAPSTAFANGVVYLNGVRQVLTTDYTVTNATTGEITFTSNQTIQAGDVVIIDYNDQ
jgi:hypothetical protein